MLWTALHLRGELLGLRVRSLGTTSRPRLVLDVYTRRRCPAARRRELGEALAASLSVGQDLAPFYRQARKDPILRHALGPLFGMHDTSPSHLFAAATLAILLQMAPLARSEAMMACVIRRFGDVARFAGQSVRVFPTPERIAEVGVHALRPCRLGYRAGHLVRLARRLARGDFPTLEELERMSPEAAKERLLELPGIGGYSAGIITPHASFPIDVWSAEVFSQLFFGKGPGRGPKAIDRVRREGERRWGEHAWLAFFYVVQDLGGLSERLGVPLRLQ